MCKPRGNESRVPTLLAGPVLDGGGRVRERVSTVDLAPTLLDAAGVPLPAGLHGRSVLPLLRGDRQGWPDHVFLQISESQVGRAIIRGVLGSLFGGRK